MLASLFHILVLTRLAAMADLELAISAAFEVGRTYAKGIFSLTFDKLRANSSMIRFFFLGRFFALEGEKTTYRK